MRVCKILSHVKTANVSILKWIAEGKALRVESNKYAADMNTGGGEAIEI
jgi:hypothetical protein